MDIGKAQPIPTAGVRFSMVPNNLFTDRSLEPQDCVTWCYLCLYARGRGFAVVTDAKMAQDMGIVPMTVRRSLSRIEQAGFIRRERKGPARTIVLIPEGRAESAPFKLKVLHAG
jgi:hypothetical protein